MVNRIEVLLVWILRLTSNKIFVPEHSRNSGSRAAAGLPASETEPHHKIAFRGRCLWRADGSI